MKRDHLFENDLFCALDSEGREVLADPGEAYSDPDFMDSLDSGCPDCRSDYANEFFLYYYIKHRELLSLSRKYALLPAKYRPWSIDWNLFRLTRRNFTKQDGGILARTAFRLFYYLASLLGLVLTTSLFFYAVLRIKGIARHSELRSGGTLYLIRSKSGADKLRALETDEGDLILTDDLFGYPLPYKSIYSPVRWRLSLFVLWHALKVTTRDCRLSLSDARSMFDELTATAIISRYLLRISHKALYESCLHQFLVESSTHCRVLTANKEDRFAVLETRLCRSLGFRLHCVPHGLEYGFRFPMGLCGTVFYCNSLEAATILNDLYSDSKFVYSAELATRIFATKLDNAKEEKTGLCYFSEPRDAYVNFEIIAWMRTHKVDFCLKLHPLEDEESYLRAFPDIKIIRSLDEALAYRFCAARKSTVLLEAAYRSRIPVAVLINLKDRVYCERIFPALRDTRIEKIYALEELPALIVRKGLS